MLKLKSLIATVLLLSALLPPPSLAADGGSDSDAMNNLDREVYEIDYRGPETHSYIPPPNQSRGRPFIHHGSVTVKPNFKGPRAHNVKDEKTIHG
ncbi:PREDICTED: uncharacterized protein LOC109115044 [Nelumbo nucifera]|uniref:Uncharacterized protein LOC109115044 n=1 Tax=Nelumbo nucifera TaxID=4432 RepID=A0A1U8Q5W4_NELNU|nr:PREDICTED: uncharacterized protein LOC109115044 [Nelumbo nucifera]